MLFAGREKELLGVWAFPAMSVVPESITTDDVEEFARTCARPDGWRGAAGGSGTGRAGDREAARAVGAPFRTEVSRRIHHAEPVSSLLAAG